MSYQDILDAREKRKDQIISFLSKYPDHTVISIKANIPGPEKNINEADVIVNYFSHVIKNEFENIKYHQTHESHDGPFSIFIIEEKGIIIKEKCVNIEDNYELGRLVDLDVYYQDYFNILSRRNLGYDARKCFICDDFAHNCTRSQKHSQTTLIDQIEKQTHTFIINKISDIALDAMYSELNTFPKCGLVSIIDNGIHTDMDYETFKTSIETLKPFIKEYAKAGFKQNPFNYLRKVGIKAEKELLEATHGVNTLKGANFLIGFTVPSLVNAIYNNKSFNEVRRFIKNICKDITKNDFKDLDKKEYLTYGEKIYLKYQLKGIRGEVENGLKSIFDLAMIEYQKALILNENDRNIHTLIALMSIVDDTTLLHKFDIDVLYEVKNTFKELLNMGGYLSKEGKNKYYDLHKEYLQRGLSPGGSADLLIITILIYKSLELFSLI